ncbi:AbrB/MazE/SpoVT family DNA-binding domain-containing protein [Pseudomonas sp. R2.Fl]|nr:AbrB/MazE/SpoVT family DNA-binding domain-containing protein [Pseudomonas sp. R2.Fl]
MTTLTVTAKGQVTLKQEFLRHLDVKPGDKLTVSALPGGKLELTAVRPKQGGGLEKFFGSLKNKHDIHFTIDELQDEIEKAWAGEK